MAYSLFRYWEKQPLTHELVKAYLFAGEGGSKTTAPQGEDLGGLLKQIPKVKNPWQTTT